MLPAVASSWSVAHGAVTIRLDAGVQRSLGRDDANSPERGAGAAASEVGCGPTQRD